MPNIVNNKKKNDILYNDIIKDIVNNPKYRQIQNIKHHYYTDRFSHCLNVSYLAYRIAKKLKYDYVSVARAGLLHDYFFEEKNEFAKGKEQTKLILRNHPLYALNNANKILNLNDIERDAILCHMCPFSRFKPKYHESWVVSIADDIISIKEQSYILKHSLSTCLLLIFNWFIN